MRRYRVPTRRGQRRKLSPAITALSVLAAALSLGLPASASAGLLGWGENINAQIGAGYRSSYESSPRPLPGLPANVVEISAGEDGNVARTASGEVWTWGSNQYGQGCIGAISKPVTTPYRVPGLVAQQVSEGGGDTVILLPNGTVDVCGSNIFGEGGNGTSTAGKETVGEAIPSPTPVRGLEHVARVSGGADIAALMADGTVKVWGPNQFGQLALGFTSLNVTVPTTVPHLSGVAQVVIGAYAGFGGHMLVRLQNGTVLAAGRNNLGALGDGNLTDSYTLRPVLGLPAVVEVAAGFYQSLARTAEGRVFSWGANNYGELGTGKAGPELCGLTTCSRRPLALGITGVSSIKTGFGYDLAASATSGGVYAWGVNEHGELGRASANLTMPTPVPGLSADAMLAAGNHHALAAATMTPAAPPLLSAQFAGGACTLTWSAPASTPGVWHLSWRETRDGAISIGIALPTSARSYTIRGLKPGVRWSAIVSNELWGHRTVEGTP
jgi:alpha-tubulin suppressor-like RCC1 family protein